MGIVINVDTGVSFTHAVATDKNEIGWAKVETNQGNPKRSLFSCLQELARKLDLTPAEMLAHTLFIRWSSSIASELLAQGGRGKLGLVVSKDLENVLRSSGQGETGLPSYLAGLVRSDMIVGIKGEIDRSGRVIEDVRRK
jgi:N-methylhydantoinase A/oxoprolinase/acetone carboxylase beta subunit